jgi:2-polyprenyl-6-methoxyphenol hydroxylase-like FAD-dependent oxidoreductase
MIQFESSKAKSSCWEAPMSDRTDYDAIIVGASLAGCAAATLLARAGAHVALIERKPDPDAFKRICSHYIQSSAVPTLERLGVLDEIIAAGGVRSGMRFWTRWGMIEPPDRKDVPAGVNIRRELLDPMLRARAAREPGVELVMGRTVTGLLRDGDHIEGVQHTDRHGHAQQARARLVVAADGRDSPVAELAEVPTRTLPHGRFAYGAYFEGPSPAGAPDGTIWFLDPQWAAAFPTDNGLTFYGCMLTKEHLAGFRGDLDGSLRSFMASLPDAPPILESRAVSPVLGKLEMPNVLHEPVAPGLALIGDAALATDPLFGVGCGWALQGEEPLQAALQRYRRRHRRGLKGHASMIHDYATGRPLSRIERILFSAAAWDPKVAVGFGRFGTRNAPPSTLGPTLLRALAVHARRRLRPGRQPGHAGAGTGAAVA